jgi:hypothetical protein
MQNSELPELPTPLTVVAHDAGATNLIISWLRHLHHIDIRVCLAGPAVDLWVAAYGETPNLSLNDALAGSTTLLSGTSFSSDLEHQARILAKKLNIYSIAVIDHWVNYPERFIFQTGSLLPDEIWVSDEYALALAKDFFPAIEVHQFQNFYLDSLVDEVRIFDSFSHSSPVNHVLYLLEPIRHPWASGEPAGEFQALDFFIMCASQLYSDSITQIRLRPHPSDYPGKYDLWIDQHRNWNLHIDPGMSLAESIAWSDIVIGCETYAMVVALSAGRRVYSSLPPHAPRCRLPMKNISHLRDLVQLHH